MKPKSILVNKKSPVRNERDKIAKSPGITRPFGTSTMTLQHRTAFANLRNNRSPQGRLAEQDSESSQLSYCKFKTKLVNRKNSQIKEFKRSSSNLKMKYMSNAPKTS